MAKNCEIPSDFRSKYGFSEEFFKSIRLNVKPVEFTKDQVRNIVKNLGLDDARAIHLREGKGHIFGRNLKDITEFDASKGGVPKDTLVKKVNNDGEIEYFVSERSTDSMPSKWVTNDNGNVMPNPNWTYVGQNATVTPTGALRRYGIREDGHFVEGLSDDYLLKVSKIYEGPHRNRKWLADRGYDAVRYDDGSIKVLDTATQAIEPERITIRDTKVGVDETTTKPEPEPEQIQKELETLGVGPHLAFMGAGAVAGSIATEDQTGTWAGGLLGLALGMPAVRTKMKGVLKGDSVDAKSVVKSIADAQEKARNGWDAKTLGYAGNPADEKGVATFMEKFGNSFKKAREMGENARQMIFKNNFVQSGITTFADMGIPLAQSTLRQLQRTETAHNPYMAVVADVINKTFGQGVELKEFTSKQIDVMKEFVESKPEIATIAKDDALMRDEMGASIRRIITHEASLDDAGNLALKDDRYVTENVYGKRDIREQDAFILNHPEGRKLVEAHREIFDRMGEKATKSLQNAIDQVELEGNSLRVFRNFLDSGLSIKQWKAQASDHMLKLYNTARENIEFKEGVQFREKQLKIQNLKGRYVPQIQSHEKIARLKKEFIENNTIDGQPLSKASAQKQDELWADEFQKRIIAYNHDGFTVRGLDAGGMDVETIYFRKFDNAVKQLRNIHVNDILDDGVRARVLKEVQSGDPTVLEKYIGQKVINGKTSYYLKQPEDLDYNIVRDMSRENMGKAQRLFLNMSTVRQSNYLDNPRQFILPNEMLETNTQTLFERYSRDVGTRTHLIDVGLGTKNKLDRRLAQIDTKLREKGIEGDFSKEMDNVRSWYSVISNTKSAVELDMSKAEVIRRARVDRRNNKIARTIMNLATMPFMWFTTVYAPFTPAILGTYFSGVKNMAKTYKELATDPDAVKNMTENLYKYGALTDKLRSHVEEAQYGSYRRDMLESNDNAVLDWMYNISQKGIDATTKFSLGKSIASAMGKDIENAGAMRLLTGDLYQISGVESAMVNMAVMKEVEDMAEAGIQIIKAREAGEEITEAIGGGKNFTLGTIKRRLDELNVEDPERFIRETMERTDGVRQSENIYKHFTGKGTADMSEYLEGEYARMMDAVINQYHGRTKLTRPLKWVDNVYGRTLSQFSVYAQNFGVQTVRRRIYQPLKDWKDSYPVKESDASLFEMFWNLQRGNNDRLKEIFGEDNWLQAVDDFPVEAVDAIMKVTPVALGAGAVMNLSRDAYIDMLNMTASEAMGNDDYEAWEKSWVDRPNLRAIFGEETEGFDTAKLVTNGLTNAVNMGYFSRWAQIVRQSEYGNIADVTPATGMMGELFDTMGEPFRSDWTDMPTTVPKAVADYTLLRSPFIGTFHGLRETAVDAMFNQPKNKQFKVEDLEF